ncbi:MAG: NAD-dependent epimerase/dehydratase family protein [Candidatus Omnitrophota bacterium]|jgi:UDP-2-acetamido-2,6-beta-L-arabino-hexul-4-ose reductase
MKVRTEKVVLVTGADGFVGRNLQVALSRRQDLTVECYDLSNEEELLAEQVARADVIFHLAGVNRPTQPAEFTEGNAALTQRLVEMLRARSTAPRVLMPSSIQADFNNPYGVSKKAAEDALRAYARDCGAYVKIYRLPGIFGKWSRPNYNTVVATFCHNIARALPIEISEPGRSIELVYIDDLVDEMLGFIDEEPSPDAGFCRVKKVYRITLQDLAGRIQSFERMRRTLVLPDMSDELTARLHSTYLSFLPEDQFSYVVDVKTDERGDLFELLKSASAGQVFLSRTKAGITRGNHYHDMKVEKFCVVRGRAVIRFRSVLRSDIIEYPVSDKRIEVVDIPPGYAHNIENVGDDEMIVLFWSSQQFDPLRPDTHFLKV